MPNNRTLLAATRNDADEFYTRYEDVARGLEPYRARFRGADVLLDTNDGDWSAFWRFLNDRFDDWGIRRIRSVAWDPTFGTLFEDDELGGVLYTRIRSGSMRERLDCAGSFDDPRVLDMAHGADLVVGNPLFSRMGDYLARHADVDLLCLGPMTAAAYSRVFPHVLSGRLHIVSGNRGSMFFRVPHYGAIDGAVVHVEPDGVPAVGVKGVVWYTTLPGECSSFTPGHRYSPRTNPVYDNLPHTVMEAGSAALVPADWDGYVGAPVSLLANWPSGYRLAGVFPNRLPEGMPRVLPEIGGRQTFRRLLIERV